MIVVDNNDAKENELLKVYKEVRRLISVRNYVAKKWIENELQLREEMPDNFQNAYYRDYVKELLKRKKKIVKDVKESIIDIRERDMQVYLMTTILTI